MQRFLTLAFSVLVLAGCTSSKESILPELDLTMKDIYSSHSNLQGVQSARMSVQTILKPEDVNNDAYTLHNIKKPKYSLIDNPTLYMYVNSALSVDRSPLPAFITEFKLYERDEYALPHEVNINWSNE